MLDVSDFAHSMRMVNDLNYSLVALGSVRADKEGWCYRNFYINFNKIYFMREGEVTITKKIRERSVFFGPDMYILFRQTMSMILRHRLVLIKYFCM